MARYIELDAVLAEIERRIKRFREEKDSVSIIKTNTYKGILSFLNTLEGKEVDLDKPFEGVKVQTSMESGSLDEVIVTTKYKAQKGEGV